MTAEIRLEGAFLNGDFDTEGKVGRILLKNNGIKKGFPFEIYRKERRHDSSE